MKRALPNDKPLGEPKQKFEDTFSAETVVLIKYLARPRENTDYAELRKEVKRRFSKTLAALDQ